ncbi:protein ERGIC-53-like [Erinaceus europaeus]|uniref:Protein ERGIC-53-like n=1 Tax=Erinaceus europaeus TaxID=9365 RepID=A0ABM3W0Y2_ERIEU|nr:protein ERGIC-53-like [Erinaceus europaeus]
MWGLLQTLSTCLLLLLPCCPEGTRVPHRRFEYKFSFKGPRLAVPGAGIPFWSHHGDAILGPEELRLAPSLPGRRGAVWTRAPAPFLAWQVDVQLRVTGRGRWGAQGMAVWYSREGGHGDSVLGGPATRDSIAVVLDSGSSQGSPAIRLLAWDGHTASTTSPSLGGGRELGSCHRDFRNRPYPFRVRVTYWGQRLRVTLSSGLTAQDPEEDCFSVGPLALAPGGLFGVSAATGNLADDHDVLSFLAFSLRDPDPEVPPLPALQREQLRLEAQLEGLRLALGSREDGDPGAQEESVAPGLAGDLALALGDTLHRHRQVLQELQGLSQQLSQAGRGWTWELEAVGQAGPKGAWDSTQAGALLRGQLSLLQHLRPLRDAAAHMASAARPLYLPAGTQHHFSELEQLLELLQRDLRGLVRAAKAPHTSGQHPKALGCLQPGLFLLFLLAQAAALCCLLHFRQQLDQHLQELLSTHSPARSPAPHFPRVLGAMRRQPPTPSAQA